MIKNKKLMFLGLIGTFAFALTLIAIPASAQVTTFSQIGGNTTLRVGSRGESVRAYSSSWHQMKIFILLDTLVQ